MKPQIFLSFPFLFLFLFNFLLFSCSSAFSYLWLSLFYSYLKTTQSLFELNLNFRLPYYFNYFNYLLYVWKYSPKIQYIEKAKIETSDTIYSIKFFNFNIMSNLKIFYDKFSTKYCK